MTYLYPVLRNFQVLTELDKEKVLGYRIQKYGRDKKTADDDVVSILGTKRFTNRIKVGEINNDKRAINDSYSILASLSLNPIKENSDIINIQRCLSLLSRYDNSK